MQIFRTLGLAVLSFGMISTTAFAGETESKTIRSEATSAAAKPAAQQQLVETVDIQGNRRLRDDDLLYYIKTRPGDVYDAKQLERDLKELLSLNFFDKTATRVLVEDGVRGGVNVIFEVRELPLIRDLVFEGLKVVQESDVLKEFREKRAGISKEAVYDPVKARNATRILRELLAGKGYPNAKVTIKEEEISATSIAVTFQVEQGSRSRIIKIDFDGNENFSDRELRNALQLVKSSGFISRFKGMDVLDMRKLQYDLQKNVRQYMFSKGYFRAQIGEPEVVGLGNKRTGFPYIGKIPLPLLTSKDDTLQINIPVTEGKIYRVGDVKIEGNSIFSEQQIASIVGLKKGEIADGKQLQEAVYENMKKIYGAQGFVLYNAEFEPDFKDNPANAKEGIVDIKISIEEGRQFRLRRLEFSGNTFTRDQVMRREFLINEGDIYNQIGMETSVIRLNQTGYFDPIDKDQDVDVRTDEDQGDVDLLVKVKEKGRQQISFNGGVSGLSGTSFGLEYSTNNLLGRGEILSFNFGLGNRQQSFQIQFQEPYFRDRPISVGFSLFASKYQFFGEGTFLTQNENLLSELYNPYGQITTDEANLFTQKTYGATVFATAPLSEFFPKRQFTKFSRVGVTYQFSSTTIQDPKVNSSADASVRIPVIYAQPSIITSRITPTFVYDTRQPSANGIDTARGTQISAQFAFAGLGGDVRSYQPSVSFSQFIPIRKRRSKNPEVFAYRIQFGTIGTWSPKQKILNANSLSFVGGVPLYERYFLGSEYDIRGYNTRSISPITPFDTFVTSRNVKVATSSFDTATTAPGLSTRTLNDLISLGTLTGHSGNNNSLYNSTYRFTGGDTQILGNFEYRIPIFGPVGLAAFADIGSVLNLRKTGDQFINTEFLEDSAFLGASTLTLLTLRNNLNLESSNFSLLYYRGRILTKSDYLREFCRGNRFGCPTTLSPEIQPLYIRGEVQQNSILRNDNSNFAKWKDYKASVGLELRVQVPVVNVPFRLIYYYNPNAQIGYTENIPGIYLPGDRNGFRFTVGRTF